jgi:hypothetical protein
MQSEFVDHASPRGGRDALLLDQVDHVLELLSEAHGRSAQRPRRLPGGTNIQERPKSRRKEAAEGGPSGMMPPLLQWKSSAS